MKKLIQLATLMTLGAAMALAQGTPDKSPASTPPTLPQTQQQSPQTPDQTQPGAQPSTPSDQTPQGSPTTTDQGTKAPQNDTSAGMASSTNDIQNNIESAIKQDPNLSSSNVQVKVTDKKVELSGNVSSNDQKKAAEKIAKDNSGGRKVKDHIKVANTSTSNPDQTKNPGAYPKQ